jgi:regulator of protease activity HflC (stomatin/prohibitin superfamily)
MGNFAGFIIALIVMVGSMKTTGAFRAKSVHGGKIFLSIVLGLITFTALAGIVIVPSGNVGVVTKFGAVTEKIFAEGLHVILPGVEEVQLMSVAVEAYSTEADSASKDLQRATTKITLNFQLDPKRAGDIYRTMRRDYVPRVVDPSLQESIKAATAAYGVSELVVKREAVRQAIRGLLVEKLEKPYGLIIRDVSITDFAFSDEFDKSIELKQKAVQEAERAKNDLERVRMESEQSIVKAKAEAESLRLQKGNITPEMLELRKIEVQKAAIDMMDRKWDGKYPSTMMSAGGATGTTLMLPLPGAK